MSTKEERALEALNELRAANGWHPCHGGSPLYCSTCGAVICIKCGHDTHQPLEDFDPGEPEEPTLTVSEARALQVKIWGKTVADIAGRKLCDTCGHVSYSYQVGKACYCREAFSCPGTCRRVVPDPPKVDSSGAKVDKIHPLSKEAREARRPMSPAEQLEQKHDDVAIHIGNGRAAKTLRAKLASTCPDCRRPLATQADFDATPEDGGDDLCWRKFHGRHVECEREPMRSKSRDSEQVRADLSKTPGVHDHDDEPLGCARGVCGGDSMNIKRLLVCGGRDYNDREAMFAVLDSINPWSIIQGGATGADRIARLWATVNDIPCETYNPDWKMHGRAAGPIRNSMMLKDSNPDMVLAAPGGRGTADMVCKAKAAGVDVQSVEGMA